MMCLKIKNQSNGDMEMFNPLRQKLLFTTTTLVFFISFLSFNLNAAYLQNVPQKIAQPNGDTIDCFATGDEFYNWLHDKEGYTIVQNPTTGFYCYAVSRDDSLIATEYVVGTTNLSLLRSIKPFINYSSDKIGSIRRKASDFMFSNREEHKVKNKNGNQFQAPTQGKINNIVFYVRFSDQPEFTDLHSKYTNMFNTASNSMRNYFKEVSYNKLDIESHFFPTNNGTNIISYQDPKPRSYYCEYNPVTNPGGYKNDSERKERERDLIINVVMVLGGQLHSSLNVDGDNDDEVDNITLIIRGQTESNELLWPHKWTFSLPWYVPYNLTLNDKEVYSYNFLIEGYNNTAVASHEMFHTLGAPDLYHYNQDGATPVGPWDLMASHSSTPQHISAYMKSRYLNWINTIPMITNTGTYTINPLTSSTNNCYMILIKNSGQFIIIEYRNKSGIFESNVPGSGLVIYRTKQYQNGTYYSGNANGAGPGGVTDEVYVFRPDGSTDSNGNGNVSNAYFSEASGRVEFNNYTNPHSFYTQTNDPKEIPATVQIDNIRTNSNGTMSFDVCLCNETDIYYSNTSSLPANTNAINSITTGDNVTVKSGQNVKFEAGGSVKINQGFKVEAGSSFQISIEKCGLKP